MTSYGSVQRDNMMNDEKDLAFAKAVNVNHDGEQDDEIVVVDEYAVKVVNTSAAAATATADAASSKNDMQLQSMQIAPGSDVEEAVPDHLVKGEVQPSQYRDAWATVLFLMQCAAMLGVAIAYFPYIGQVQAANGTNGTAQNDDFTSTTSQGTDNVSNDTERSGFDFLFLLLMSYVIAGLLTMVALTLMMRYSEALVKISFFVAPLSFFAIAVILSPFGDDTYLMFTWFAFIFSMVSFCCWFFYKKHIPFAAANLRSALTALRMNSATFGLAFLFSTVSFAAMIVWAIALLGVQSKSDSQGQVECSVLHTDDDTVVYQPNQMCDTHPPNPVLMAALLLGFYWTQQVVQNVVHVTTAGVVGSWWFAPMGDPSCCSPTVTSSLSRAVTYSFGSICFGSLLVSIMKVLEYFVRDSNRNGRDCSIFGCILEVRVWIPLLSLKSTSMVCWLTRLNFICFSCIFKSASCTLSAATWSISTRGHLCTLAFTAIPTLKRGRT